MTDQFRAFLYNFTKNPKHFCDIYSFKNFIIKTNPIAIFCVFDISTTTFFLELIYRNCVFYRFYFETLQKPPSFFTYVFNRTLFFSGTTILWCKNVKKNCTICSRFFIITQCQPKTRTIIKKIIQSKSIKTE